MEKVANTTSAQKNKIKKERKESLRQIKIKNKRKQLVKTILYYSFLAIITTFIIFWFGHFQEVAYYPEWGNGEKVLSTKGNITNRYVDENTGEVYTEVTYTASDKKHQKWFQTDLGDKSIITVYYVENNPFQQSRLTDPVAKKDMMIYNIVLIISLVVFVVTILIKKFIVKKV